MDQGSAVRVANYPDHLTDTLVRGLIPGPTTAVFANRARDQFIWETSLKL